jgi:DNA ligase-1
MKAFTELYTQLDRTTRTNEKVVALEVYFRQAIASDAAWALWFLTGQRSKRAVKTSLLRLWAAEAAALPLWLVEECYETVGDLAETLALIMPVTVEQGVELSLSELVEQRLLPLSGAAEYRQHQLIQQSWRELRGTELFLWHKMITGSFRVGVSRALVVRALAKIAGVDAAVMMHRLMGNWKPSAADYEQLLAGSLATDHTAQPYPFYLASALDGDITALGDIADWQLEWKWDGIRAQLLRRAGQTVIWSRGEEIITPGFPEIQSAAALLPEGTVLDGELLAWKDGAPMPFAHLQRRLNRNSAAASLQREVPIVFMAYDLLEYGAQDWRSHALSERREQLEKLISGLDEDVSVNAKQSPAQGELFSEFIAVEAPPPQRLQLSTVLTVSNWDELAVLQQQARRLGVEGLMIKQRSSDYRVGRQRGSWWKWKVMPYVCDAVLIAAQPGHGRRATLFTDYTFGVWKGEELVPVAKAYSGLTDKEIQAVDAFVRGHTIGRFGPVRTVQPELVFELAFEGVAASTRHKSGIALRFPRISRWRQDKLYQEADTLQNLQELAAGKAYESARID